MGRRTAESGASAAYVWAVRIAKGNNGKSGGTARCRRSQPHGRSAEPRVSAASLRADEGALATAKRMGRRIPQVPGEVGEDEGIGEAA